MNCLSRKHTSYLVNAHCEVKEDDDTKKECCHFTWLNLAMETRPEENTSFSENNSLLKESYTQRQVDHFVARRSLDQRIWLGRQGQRMEEYHLPYQSVLPVPIFVPSKASSPRDSYRTHTPEELRSAMDFERGLLSGVCTNKQEVSQITKDIPKVIQPTFRASCLITPPGESTETLQRC